MAFPDLPKHPDFPHLEEGILRFWKQHKIFERSLKQTKNRPPFVIFEGPPTANGKPHIGHVATRVFKDIVPRYKTMRGFYVVRKGGWDTHGLPVEIEVEKELGISGKQEIENLVPGDPIKSIAKFNERCRRSVWKYVDLWRRMIDRVGNWFDLDQAYVTYDKDYIESVWWAFKEYWTKGLLYRGYKVVPYCTRCGTPLSSHEVAQGYEEVEDASIYLRFPLLGEKETALLAWTTTPWTLPGNVALAVDPKADYVKAREKKREGEKERYLIAASDRAAALGLTDIVKTMKGSDLIGKRYQPPFPWLRALVPKEAAKYLVVGGDFVDLSEGTGIVHTAVMYGEEDFALGTKLGLPQRHLVDKNGRFIAETGWLASKYVKDADPLIVHDLKSRGLIFREERIRHQYPFCWRCHRPLLYYALESWFIKTTAVQKELIKNNRGVNWVPPYVGKGRMSNWYETLIDWSISRNRFWGTPLPAWVCDKNPAHIEVIGSYAELAQRFGRRLPRNFDPHRPGIDTYTWPCREKDGGVMRRTPEVTDVWHDSGCMPFAQWHYPFEGKDVVEEGKQFPADYISEAIDQTRGWFFSLQAVSTMLFGQTPYKNVVVFEHALDEKGRKMSKHLGNVIDPWEVFAAIGADPMRWFFLTSVTIGTPYRCSMEIFREIMRRFFLIFWNCVSFFTTYASYDDWQPAEQGKPSETGGLLDRWIIARVHELTAIVTEKLDGYDFPAAGRLIQDFVVNDLSTWYIRRSRDRVGPGTEDRGDKAAFFSTMYQVLRILVALLAPFIPFLSEYFFQILRQPKDPLSVHLLSWPKPGRIDRRLLSQMTEARMIVEEGLRIRKEKNLPLRQPLARISLSGAEKWPPALRNLVAQELNVKAVRSTIGKRLGLTLDTRITPALKEEGTARELIRIIQNLRKKAGLRFDDRAAVELVTTDRHVRHVATKHRRLIEESTLTKFGKVTKPEAEEKVGPIRVAVVRNKRHSLVA